MFRVITILAAVVAMAVAAAPASSINDGTSNTRAAFTPPQTPATPPGVPVPYPTFRGR